MVPNRYFEDFEAGMVFEFGDYEVTESEMIAFAKAYDPQPFHTQPIPPENCGSDRLIASGWHTCAMTMRLMVDHFIPPATVMPSPGLEGLKWLSPVYPGDRLGIRITVLAARPSETKPDRGIVRLQVQTLNQRNDIVQDLIQPAFFRRCSA